MSLERFDDMWIAECCECGKEQNVSAWDSETKSFWGAKNHFICEGWKYDGNSWTCFSCAVDDDEEVEDEG